MANWEKLIEEHYSKKNKIDEKTIFELIEQALIAEGYQDSEVIKNHPSMRLSTKGTKKTSGDPYDEDPPKARSKSAPAGFGALGEDNKNLHYTQLKGANHHSRVSTMIDRIENDTPFETTDGQKVVLPADENADLLATLRGILDGTDPTEKIFAMTADGVEIETKMLRKTTDFGGKGGGKMEPNRGEVAEALLALAITKRFMNLPSSSSGAVSDTEILHFLKNEVQLQDIPQKGKKPPKKKLFFQGKIKSPKGATDTIQMEVVLRGFSMEGLMPEQGVVGDFIKNDSKIKSYLKAAADYANREVVDFAIGTFDAPDEIPEARKIGWYINDFDNDIFVGAIGTGDQKGTKVDLKMTCKKANECPLDTFNPIRRGTDSDGNPEDIRVEPEDTTRRSSLSLKAGETKHIGQQGARFAESALGLMESLFGAPLSDKVEWSKKYNYHAQFIADSGTPEEQEGDSYKFIVKKSRSGKHLYAKKLGVSPPEDEIFTKDEVKVKKAISRGEHEKMLKKMVRDYLEVAQAGLKGKGTDSDAGFIEKLSDGIKRQAVLGEEGVDLVQFTDKDDYDILNFYEVARVLETLNTDLYAEITSAGEDNPPYLTIYNSAIIPEVQYRTKEKPSKTISKADYEKKARKAQELESKKRKSPFDPSAWEEYQPDSADANTLVRIRPLLRKGAPLIRVEKGELLKKKIRREKGKIKLFTNGKVVTIDDPEQK